MEATGVAMTYDELLTKVENFNSDDYDAIALGEVNYALYALKAIIVLCNPIHNSYISPDHILHVIEKELSHGRL
jgi:hypothetical protein